jgi:hypothetical protein
MRKVCSHMEEYIREFLVMLKKCLDLCLGPPHFLLQPLVTRNLLPYLPCKRRDEVIEHTLRRRGQVWTELGERISLNEPLLMSSKKDGTNYTGPSASALSS